MPGKCVPQSKSFVNDVPFLIKKEKGIGDYFNGLHYQARRIPESSETI